jgi:hypothetical protein
MTLRKLHGWSAVVIAAYALVHLANHLAGLNGVETHIAFMRVARVVYRSLPIEVLLLGAAAVQIYSGATFVVRGWRQRHGFVSWLQASSGAYMVFFFLFHVGAVMFGRGVLHLDTNFYFAAAGFYVPPFQYFFAPYYFLAVLALFTHLGCALYWQLQRQPRAAQVLAIALPSSVGFCVSLVIVLTLAGTFYPVRVPAEYTAIYRWRP